MRVLALDVGKTGCRAALFDDGVRVAEAEGPGAAGLAAPDGVSAALDATDATARSLGPRRPDLDVVAAGLAGFAAARGRADEVAAALAARHRPRRVVLASDMTTSHLGALDGEAGVVVAAGTGAVALAVAADGGHAVTDGWGWLLGDAGSGFEIGRRGLDAALRAHDGRGGSPALLERARDRFGPPEGIPAAVHGAPHPASTVASFARDVLDVALAGDVWARTVWVEAGAELAASAAAAAGRALGGDAPTGPGDPPTPVSTTGGLFGSALLADAFAAELARRLPTAALRPPAGDALDGAHLAATRPALPHASLLLRRSTDT